MRRVRLMEGAERRSETIRQARLEREMADVRKRLQRVCSEWPSDEFEAFVERVARIRIKYLMRRSEDLFIDARNQQEPRSN